MTDHLKFKNTGQHLTCFTKAEWAWHATICYTFKETIFLIVSIFISFVLIMNFKFITSAIITSQSLCMDTETPLSCRTKPIETTCASHSDFKCLSWQKSRLTKSHYSTVPWRHIILHLLNYLMPCITVNLRRCCSLMH